MMIFIFKVKKIFQVDLYSFKLSKVSKEVGQVKIVFLYQVILEESRKQKFWTNMTYLCWSEQSVCDQRRNLGRLLFLVLILFFLLLPLLLKSKKGLSKSVIKYKHKEYENIFTQKYFISKEYFSFSFWQSLVSVNVSNTSSLEGKAQEKNINSTATITNKRASSMTTRTLVLLLHIFVKLLSKHKMNFTSSTSITNYWYLQ
jgi:hypothetical protein